MPDEIMKYFEMINEKWLLESLSSRNFQIFSYYIL
jgi:hypothetical protein